MPKKKTITPEETQKKLQEYHAEEIKKVLEWLDYAVIEVDASVNMKLGQVFWTAEIGQEVPGEDKVKQETLTGAYTTRPLGMDRIIKISVVTGIGLAGHRYHDYIDQTLALCERFMFKDWDRNKLAELALRDALNTAALNGTMKHEFEDWYLKTWIHFKQNVDQFYAHVDIENGTRPIKEKRKRHGRKKRDTKFT